MNSARLQRAARIIDSHTGGEPTRLIVEGGPDLGGGSMAERLQRMRSGHDPWRRALANEPRGNDVIVGGLLCRPVDPAAACGVIFFNNVGYLGMCGHGTIGVVASLAYLGLVGAGLHRIETPVGMVTAALHDDGSVTVSNVPAYRYRRGVSVVVAGHGRVTGDIAWGGNWFFLCADHGLALDAASIPALLACSEAIRAALTAQGITGEGGAEIDHIELLGPAQTPGHHGRNFVLCPGGAYDRSPCGTGTSAKLACLAADGHWAPREVWHQESVIGSVFSAHYERETDASGSGRIRPHIRGRAHVTLDAWMIVDAEDPFGWGLAAR